MIIVNNTKEPEYLDSATLNGTYSTTAIYGERVLSLVIVSEYDCCLIDNEGEVLICNLGQITPDKIDITDCNIEITIK